MINAPLFSILHTSARPHAWRAVYEDWLSKADSPELVEYVLVVDKRWGFEELPVLRPQDKVLWNVDRQCYVEGVNIAARAATGKILIVNADDQFTAHCWDTDLKEVLLMASTGGEANREEFVVWARTGTRDEVERGIIVMPIVSRARFQKLGYLFYPGYESMYADNDLCAHAKQDGVIIDAPELMFPHRHPLVDKATSITGGDWDEAYRAQNRAQAYALGEKLFKARQAVKFQEVPKFNADADRRKIISFGLPGDSFPKVWVNQWTELLFNLGKDYMLLPIFSEGSHVHIVRQSIADCILQHFQKPDYIVWIDSDNLVRPDQLRLLIQDLDEHPEASMVVGWCHCLSDVYRESGGDVSCGYFDPRGIADAMPLTDLRDAETDMVEIDYSGFPLVVMRYELLAKTGKLSFAPIMCEDHPWGFHPEDVAFCKRAKEAGGRLFVDRRVRVPHLKLRAAEPVEFRMEQSERFKELVEK